MLTPAPQLHFHAVSLAFAPSGDNRQGMLTALADDGTVVELDCNDAMWEMLAKSRIAAPPPMHNDIVHADVGSDVSERIKAQQENVESRRIFEDLFANSDAAIIDHDFSALFRAVQELKRDGVLNLRSYIADSPTRLERLVDVVEINNANAAALRMLSVSSLHELGKQSINILDIAEGMFQGETRIRRSEYLVAGGTPIPVVYSARIPRTEEEARRVPIVIMDLSDIRLAEAARQATAAKSKFLSSMSHEIRTPLNGVIGNLELLALTSLSSEQLDLIDDADKAAKALLGLVGNILDFSKIEAGKLSMEIGDMSPAALVEEAVGVLQSLGRQKKIFVVARFGPDVPSLVRGDAMRVRQILLNLIGNAVKFTDQGGVQVSLTVTAWDHEVCELRFDVHDSGRGFDQMLAGRLFETFTQDRTPVDGAEGTGLGLSICKSLVEAFGGTIGCLGVPGEGATFWFTLPVAVVRRAPTIIPPDLKGVAVAMIGNAEEASLSLTDYFSTRGATVVTQPHRSKLMPEIMPAPESDRGRKHWATSPDIAIIFPDDAETDYAETAAECWEQHTFPLIYSSSQPPRTWLRQGFVTSLRPDATAEQLDHNFRLLVGNSKASDRLAAQQAAVVSAFAPALLGMNVLVLEDRLINRTVIEKQLKKLGIDCELAVDGVKGLEMIGGQKFDLILCDCSMPVMNGYDFTRTLRQREKAAGDGRHVPVVALTANAFREDAEKCFEAGMDDFISKPVTMDRLAAMLLKWLSPSKPEISAEDESVTPAASLPPIDLGILAEILGTTEALSTGQILADFMDVAQISLSEARDAVERDVPDAIKTAAHTAKGEARCAAATALADIYAELECRAEDADRSVLQELAGRAAMEVQRVERFIRNRLHGDPS